MKTEADIALEAALRLASKPNYLGNPSVIDRVLGNLWTTTYTRWAEGVADVDAGVDADACECERVARVFLGLDTDYVGMPAWNRPGTIDAHVAEVLAITNEDPVHRIACALLDGYLKEIWDVVAAVKASGRSETFQQQAGVVLEKYRNVLLGIIQPTANEDDEFGVTREDEGDEEPSK
jgi:hypothetical protein